MAFEYEVDAVDQLPRDLHDGLAWNHPLAVVQIAELHRLVFADSNPGGFDNIASQNGVLAESNVSNAFMFST